MRFHRSNTPVHPGSQRGMALVAALLLLVVITILGIGMFRSFGIQERLAGNTRDKQRALHTAEATDSFV
jgi:type IV pilus assembly protein PilX